MKKALISVLTAATLLASASGMAYAANDDGKRGGKQGGKRGPNIERMLEQLDTNSDGGISLEEVKAHQAELFGQVDANADSALTEEEYGMIGEIRKAERATNKAERTETAEKDGARKGKRGDKRGGNRGGQRGMGFERLDADNSGSVSLEEFTAHSDKMFERFDRNSDGVINADDMKRKS